MLSTATRTTRADASKDAHPAIAALASGSVLERRAAVDAIQTLDDPAIPAACLPLLTDEGLSIRRQAARAIGSRFNQVPAARRSAYVEALTACAAQGPEDVTLVCQRAIGLLTGEYASPAFSIGPHGKWVLYERRRLPVIAPAKGGRHRLLSPVWKNDDGRPDLLKLAVTNEPARDLFAPDWHPGGEALAFTPKLQRRFFQPVCVWVAGRDTVKILEPQSLKSWLPARYPAWGTTSQFAGWEGSKAIVRIYNCDDPNSAVPPDDPGVYLSYDIRTGKLARTKKPINFTP